MTGHARRAIACPCPSCDAIRVAKLAGLVLTAATFVAGAWAVLVFVFTVWGPG